MGLAMRHTLSFLSTCRLSVMSPVMLPQCRFYASIVHQTRLQHRVQNWALERFRVRPLSRQRIPSYPRVNASRPLIPWFDLSFSIKMLCQQSLQFGNPPFQISCPLLGENQVLLASEYATQLLSHTYILVQAKHSTQQQHESYTICLPTRTFV